MNGITRIETQFATHDAFIGYLTAGDGGMETTFKSALALIQGGVNVLEIGVPFSDPVADGPVIQRASNRALAQGASLDGIFALAKRIREHSEIPLILFSYLNPLLVKGATHVIKNAAAAGIDGLLLVDCPPEASTAFYDACLAEGIAPIFVVAPSTSPERIRYLSNLGRGFLYYACRKGTTGMKNTLPDDFATQIATVKANSHLPVAVGFGIASAEAATQVLNHADGVVVGSLFVKALEDGADTQTLSQLARSILERVSQP